MSPTENEEHASFSNSLNRTSNYDLKQNLESTDHAQSIEGSLSIPPPFLNAQPSECDRNTSENLTCQLTEECGTSKLDPPNPFQTEKAKKSNSAFKNIQPGQLFEQKNNFLSSQELPVKKENSAFSYVQPRQFPQKSYPNLPVKKKNSAFSHVQPGEFLERKNIVQSFQNPLGGKEYQPLEFEAGYKNPYNYLQQNISENQPEAQIDPLKYPDLQQELSSNRCLPSVSGIHTLELSQTSEIARNDYHNLPKGARAEASRSLDSSSLEGKLTEHTTTEQSSIPQRQLLRNEVHKSLQQPSLCHTSGRMNEDVSHYKESGQYRSNPTLTLPEQNTSLSTLQNEPEDLTWTSIDLRTSNDGRLLDLRMSDDNRPTNLRTSDDNTLSDLCTGDHRPMNLQTSGGDRPTNLRTFYNDSQRCEIESNVSETLNVLVIGDKVKDKSIVSYESPRMLNLREGFARCAIEKDQLPNSPRPITSPLLRKMTIERQYHTSQLLNKFARHSIDDKNRDIFSPHIEASESSDMLNQREGFKRCAIEENQTTEQPTCQLRNKHAQFINDSIEIHGSKGASLPPSSCTTRSMQLCATSKPNDKKRENRKTKIGKHAKSLILPDPSCNINETFQRPPSLNSSSERERSYNESPTSETSNVKRKIPRIEDGQEENALANLRISEQPYIPVQNRTKANLQEFPKPSSEIECPMPTICSDSRLISMPIGAREARKYRSYLEIAMGIPTTDTFLDNESVNEDISVSPSENVETSHNNPTNEENASIENVESVHNLECSVRAAPIYFQSIGLISSNDNMVFQRPPEVGKPSRSTQTIEKIKDANNMSTTNVLTAGYTFSESDSSHGQRGQPDPLQETRSISPSHYHNRDGSFDTAAANAMERISGDQPQAVVTQVRSSVIYFAGKQKGNVQHLPTASESKGNTEKKGKGKGKKKGKTESKKKRKTVIRLNKQRVSEQNHPNTGVLDQHSADESVTRETTDPPQQENDKSLTGQSILSNLIEKEIMKELLGSAQHPESQTTSESAQNPDVPDQTTEISAEERQRIEKSALGAFHKQIEDSLTTANFDSQHTAVPTLSEEAQNTEQIEEATEQDTEISAEEREKIEKSALGTFHKQIEKSLIAENSGTQTTASSSLSEDAENREESESVMVQSSVEPQISAEEQEIIKKSALGAFHKQIEDSLIIENSDSRNTARPTSPEDAQNAEQVMEQNTEISAEDREKIKKSALGAFHKQIEDTFTTANSDSQNSDPSLSEDADDSEDDFSWAQAYTRKPLPSTSASEMPISKSSTESGQNKNKQKDNVEGRVEISDCQVVYEEVMLDTDSASQKSPNQSKMEHRTFSDSKNRTTASSEEDVTGHSSESTDKSYSASKIRLSATQDHVPLPTTSRNELPLYGQVSKLRDKNKESTMQKSSIQRHSTSSTQDPLSKISEAELPVYENVYELENKRHSARQTSSSTIDGSEKQENKGRKTSEQNLPLKKRGFQTNRLTNTQNTKTGDAETNISGTQAQQHNPPSSTYRFEMPISECTYTSARKSHSARQSPSHSSKEVDKRHFRKRTI